MCRERWPAASIALRFADSRRQVDLSNAAASVIDLLVAADILEGDAPPNVHDLTCSSEASNRSARVEIEITPY